MSARLRNPLTRFLPSFESLEDRVVPAFVWPANIQWPDLPAQGTQAERTSLRRDYTQRSEAGTSSYVVTVSAAMDWDSIWTVADGKVETTNKTGWYTAKLSKYEGDNLVDSLTKSGSLAAGASGDTIHSLVVSVGRTGADLELHGFTVDQPGTTRATFEDSYRGYTVGAYNTAPLGYQFAGGTSATTKTVTTQPSPVVQLPLPGSPPAPSGGITTTTEQQFHTAFWASSSKWNAGQKGRLSIDSGASSFYSSNLVNSPWLENGAEVGRHQVVSSKYDGSSWNKSSGYLSYGDSKSTEPNYQFGWASTEHDETSKSSGHYDSDFYLSPSPTGKIDSGHANSKTETKTTVVLDKVEARDEFFATLRPPTDHEIRRKTASGFTTVSSTLTDGISTVTTNGTVTYAGGEAVCNDWSIETTASGSTETKTASETNYREEWFNPYTVTLLGVKTIRAESEGVSTSDASQSASTKIDLVGKTTQSNHERHNVVVVESSDSGVASVSTRVVADQVLWAVEKSVTASSRTGTLTDDGETEGFITADGKSEFHIVGTTYSTFEGKDSYVTTLTHPFRPKREETGETTIRRDDSKVETDIWVVEGKITTGTVKYASDREGKQTTAVRVNGEFKADDGKYRGSDFLEYDWWSDTTVGHRELATSYAAGVPTETATIADTYTGEFTVRGWGSYSESEQSKESWEQEGKGSFSGKSNGNWTRVDGKLTTGSMTVRVGDHRDVTSKAESKRGWDTTTDGVNSKGTVAASQKVRSISDQDLTFDFGVVGGIWVESGRTFDVSQQVSVNESVESKEDTYEPTAKSTKTVSATGYRFDSYSATGDNKSSTFSKTHQDKSSRTEVGSSEYSRGNGESGHSNFAYTTTNGNDRESKGTITNGIDNATWFLKRTQGTVSQVNTATHITPNGRRDSDIRHNKTFRYETSGSPASGVSSKLYYGNDYRFLKDTPTGGTPTITTSTTTFGSDWAEITVWPQQANWWEDTLIVAAWQLAGETWLGQGANWLWSHGHDVLRIGIGLLDVGVGVALFGVSPGPWGPASVAVGAGLTTLGVDQILTGFYNIRNGRIGRGYSLMETRVFEVTGSNTAAVAVPAVASLGLLFWGGGLLAANSARGILAVLPADAEFTAEAIRLGAIRGERVLAGLAELAPGERLVLIAHGNGSVIVLGGARYDAAAFVELLRGANLTPSAIELIACNTALSPRLIDIGGRLVPAASFAERVAERLGIPVTAYAESIYTRFRLVSGVESYQVYAGVTGPVARLLHSLGISGTPYRPVLWGHRPATPITFQPTGVWRPEVFHPLW